MNNIQIKPYNPYFDHSSTGAPVPKTTLPTFSYPPKNKEVKALPDRVIAFGEKWLSKDVEKYLDRMHVAVLVADYSLLGFSGLLQASVIVEYIFHTYFNLSGPSFVYQIFIPLIKVVSIPFRMAFILFAFLEGFYECIQLKRTLELISKVKDPNIELGNRLKWLHDEYSALTQREILSICDYVEWKHKKLTIEEKGNYFQTVADKYLASKFNSLKLRISPWLAEEIRGKLPTILENLKSDDNNTQQVALEQAKNLIEDINSQGEKQILLYILTLTAIVFTILAMASTFVLSSGTILIAFTVVASIIMLTRFILARGMLPEKGWHFSINNVLPKVNFSLFQSKKDPQN